MRITLTPVQDDPGEELPARPSFAATTQQPVPAVGDTVMLDGTAWTCVHRTWHMTEQTLRLELFLVRNSDYTAEQRRKALQLI